MGQADYLALGDWNAQCDQCGRKKKASQLKRNWQGLMVCADTCWEPRQPQDYARGAPPEQPPPWVRPETAPIWIEDNGVPPVDPYDPNENPQ